jgi:hypothetical protein
MKRKEPKRWVIAYHEAGHAVAARVLGIGINAMSLKAITGDSLAHVQTHSALHGADHSSIEAQIAGAEKDVKVAMAGMIAQNQVRPFGSEDGSSIADDLQNIWGVLPRIAMLRCGQTVPDIPAGERMTITLEGSIATEIRAMRASLAARLFAETHKLVQDSWSAVERVAAMMLSQDHVTEVDVDRAISAGKITASKKFKQMPFEFADTLDMMQ